MKLFVGVTNNEWFRFLSERKPAEVNFWRPRSQTDFKALQPGDLFLFKLHSPLDFIAGGGVFVRHSFLPLPLAWQAFSEKNGVPDFETFERRIRKRPARHFPMPSRRAARGRAPRRSPHCERLCRAAQNSKFVVNFHVTGGRMLSRSVLS
jgi:hypothetical protein